MVDRFVATEENIEFRNVWCFNVEDELALIKTAIKEHPYISLDCEYPIVYPHPILDSDYSLIRHNIKTVKPIQFGLVLCNEAGYPPLNPETERYMVWQVNLSDFDPGVDYERGGPILYMQSKGTDFEDIHVSGIDSGVFGSLMFEVLENSPAKEWSTFHGLYDLAYFIKTITLSDLPENINGFCDLLNLHFPRRYDLKHMMSKMINPPLFGGLEDLLSELRLPRVGVAHSAGSDALCIALAFFELRRWKGFEKHAGTIIKM